MLHWVTEVMRLRFITAAYATSRRLDQTWRKYRIEEGFFKGTCSAGWQLDCLSDCCMND